MIGSGAVGLVTAAELLSRGKSVTVYARNVDAPPASAAAPAMFTPFRGTTGGDFERRTRVAMDRLSLIARTESDAGVVLGTLREYFYHEPPSDPWMASLLRMSPLATRPPFKAIIDSVRPAIDMQRYLPWLRRRVLSMGGSLIARTVTSLEEIAGIGHRVIVNSAGVGARVLASDPSLHPMHGQVVHVPNDIGLTYSLHDDAADGSVAYIFVFQDRLVLGGSFVADRLDVATDESTMHGIVERCRTLLKHDNHPRWRELGARILQGRAAPRPTRGDGRSVFENIRVDVQELSGGARVIHHYGHGRSGVSLGWATAMEAADLVDA